MKRSSMRRFFIVLGVLFLLGALFAAGNVLESFLDKAPSVAAPVASDDAPPPVNPAIHINYKGKDYVYDSNHSVLLIMGIDDEEVTDYEGMINPSQSDFLMVAVFDHSSKTYNLIQINRDSMTDIITYDTFGKYMGLQRHQIALSHTYRPDPKDACADTLYAVSRFLYKVRIDDYFALTMNAIPVMNDAVGGVNVLVEDDFTGVDDSLVKGSTVLLKGEHAVNYVRARMSMKDDPTNENRMNRQKSYMTSLLTQAGGLAASDPEFAVSLYDKLSQYTVTDCTSDALNRYLTDFSGYTLNKIYVPSGTPVSGEKYMEFNVNEDELRDMVVEIFYDPA